MQVPEQAWYMKPLFSCLVGGILPFGAVFIELFFILTSIWLHKFYYIFGFLSLVFLILIVTCMEITIVLCYFQLCSEDYRCDAHHSAAVLMHINGAIKLQDCITTCCISACRTFLTEAHSKVWRFLSLSGYCFQLH
jgi:hypothetical protein